MENNITIREKLHQIALKAPSSSGVYQWKNEQGTILYVGKAKNLKNRLSSYFSGQKDIKTRILISKAFTIEYIVTSNEYEALILENTLIKKHNPRYNISLKDDKTYPSLKITNEDFPRIYKTRRIVQDGSQYYGPFPNVTALDTFIETLHLLYPLRQCKKFSTKNAPCMYYHIKRCAAPCCKKISKESYKEFIEEINHFLEGNPEKNIQFIENEMKKAASNLQFEKAARLRDGLAALRQLLALNVVSDYTEESRDYLEYYSEGPLVSFVVLKIRGGKLIMKDTYRTKSLSDENNVLSEFFLSYYADKNQLPERIFTRHCEETPLLQQWLDKTYGYHTKIITSDEIAENTRHQASLAMARQNAKEDILRRVRERGDMPALEELQQVLSLPKLPLRIEGFDIAHLHGKFPVASLISFYRGNPDKKNYRYYRLKTTDGIIDDFASMREVTARRYSKLVNEEESLPDLILIDGGIGQVNAVAKVLKALDLDIPLVALAEKNEELYLPGNSTPLVLPRRSDALRLLQRVRDETHRFATTQNQKLRTKENTISIFSSLPHIGEKRAKILIKEYIRLEKLAEENPEVLSKKIGLSENQSQEVIFEAKKLLHQRRKKTFAKESQTEDTYLSSLAQQALDGEVAEPTKPYNE